MNKKAPAPHIPSSEITSESAYMNRRDVMKAGVVALSLLAGVSAAALCRGLVHGYPLALS
ncbi:MAG: hypothetical protein ACJASY_004157 [Halioglobus sp.]|jgi:hypothetical protein